MSKFFNFAGHRGTKAILKVVNSSATESEIEIYAAIGKDYWNDGTMVGVKEFSAELKKIPDGTKSLTIRLQSPGGDVFEGIAIYNRINDWKIKNPKAKVTVKIDGLAASIASVIALAGHEIEMGEAGMFMIHLPWTWGIGDRVEFDKTINRLSNIEEQMLGVYAKKTGLDKEEIRAMLEEETWMGADEALEKGFITSKSEEKIPIAASLMKSPWMSKAPTKFYSQTEAAEAMKQELKNKVAARLARK